MTLLGLIQTIPPDKARLIDEILEFDSEASITFGLGDGMANRDGPDGWDKNKMLTLSIPDLKETVLFLKNNNFREASYYRDFTGEIKAQPKEWPH